MTKKVGLFGGSFNPPHLAHLIIAETVREQEGLDEVWWIPAYTPPHKAVGLLVEAGHRLAMTRLATVTQPAFVVSEVEIERGGVSFTVDTLQALQTAYPDIAFSLIIGGDSLRDLGMWHRPEEIVARVPLLVYTRAGVSRGEGPPALVKRARFVEAPLLEISSTDIRARCRTGRSIHYLVPASVRSYIMAYRLYLEEEEEEKITIR